jgi:PAS domain S-box-containing protein
MDQPFKHRTHDPMAVLAAINTALPAGICITDRHGRFVSVSDAYCHIYGYQHLWLSA